MRRFFSVVSVLSLSFLFHSCGGPDSSSQSVARKDRAVEIFDALKGEFKYKSNVEETSLVVYSDETVGLQSFSDFLEQEASSVDHPTEDGSKIDLEDHHVVLLHITNNETKTFYSHPEEAGIANGFATGSEKFEITPIEYINLGTDSASGRLQGFQAKMTAMVSGGAIFFLMGHDAHGDLVNKLKTIVTEEGASENVLILRDEKTALYAEKNWKEVLAEKQARKDWILHVSNTTVSLHKVERGDDVLTVKEEKKKDLVALAVPRLLAMDHNKDREKEVKRLVKLVKEFAEKDASDEAIEKAQVLLVVSGELEGLLELSH